MVERRMQVLGLRMEFLAQEFDASPLGRAFFQIRGVFAELERNTIRDRTARGRREKARQGKIVNPGTLPTWLRSSNCGATAELDEPWAAIARMVFRLFVEEGMTLRAIAGHLRDRGIVTPSGRGTHWQPATIQHWLRQSLPAPTRSDMYRHHRSRTVTFRQGSDSRDWTWASARHDDRPDHL